MGGPEPAGAADREQAFVHRAAGVFDRSGRGILDLASAKANPAEFLERTVSSAVKELRPGRGQPACFLNAKGRLIAGFRLYAFPGGTFRLVFFEPLREGATAALARYALLSDVSVTDRSPEVACLSVEGPAAARVLAGASGASALPVEPHAHTPLAIAGVEVTAARGGETPEGGFDIWAPRAAAAEVLAALAASARDAGAGVAGPEAAEALRIEAGIAHHGKDHGDDAFPSEVGWEHALTYDKCYVGQEIVARMRTYGHANRKLKGAIFASTLGGPPPAGTVLRVDGEEAGEVRSGARSARLGRAIALAMVKRKFWEASRAQLDGESGGAGAELVDLPFVRG